MRINLRRHVQRLDYFGSIWCRCRARSPRLRTIKLSGFPSPTVSVYELYLLILASLLSRWKKKRAERVKIVCIVFKYAVGSRRNGMGRLWLWMVNIYFAQWLCVLLALYGSGDSGRMMTGEIYEFWTFSQSFGTHITSQPVRSARPAVRALCWTLGTRKCCWVYRASHAEFRDGWRSHADPSTHRRPSESALCHWTRRQSARGVLLKKRN